MATAEDFWRIANQIKPEIATLHDNYIDFSYELLIFNWDTLQNNIWDNNDDVSMGLAHDIEFLYAKADNEFGTVCKLIYDYCIDYEDMIAAFKQLIYGLKPDSILLYQFCEYIIDKTIPELEQSRFWQGFEDYQVQYCGLKLY